MLSHGPLTFSKVIMPLWQAEKMEAQKSHASHLERQLE